MRTLELTEADAVVILEALETSRYILNKSLAMVSGQRNLGEKNQTTYITNMIARIDGIIKRLTEDRMVR